MARSRGQHVPDVVNWLKDARDIAANSVGFRIACDLAHRPKGCQPRGNSRHRRRDRPRLAAVPRCRRGAHAPDGQSLDRRRGGAQALSGPAADHITERLAFALWQKDGRVSVIADDGTVLDPSSRDRYLGLPLVVGRGAERQAKDFLAVLDRYPRLRDRCCGLRSWSPSGAGTCGSPTASTCGCRNPMSKRRSISSSQLDRDKKLSVARHHHGRSAVAGPRHRALCPTPRPQARDEALKANNKKKKAGDA